jgi:hypothetical protein
VTKHVFISIEDGKIVVDSPTGITFAKQATAESARELGKVLYESGKREWLYSSSVDFPEDYGAPDLNFRDLIEEYMWSKIPKPEGYERLRPW